MNFSSILAKKFDFNTSILVLVFVVLGGMSNIAKAFQKGKAFIPFLTCGDPDLETTEKLVKAMADGGADLIELGIPFSDPTAEGPVIQAANVRALAGGVTTDKIFEMVRRLRETVTVPMTGAIIVLSVVAQRLGREDGR